MTIVIGLTEDYYINAMQQGLFASLKENFKGRVCLLCIGFTPTDLYGINFEAATCHVTDLPSYRKDWPKNRGRYATIEAGDFLAYFSFEPDEKIIRLDADMIMQRAMSPYEEAQINCLDPGDIGMTASAFPVSTLREEFFRLNPTRSVGKIRADFPGNWGLMPLYCCGMIVCDADTYKMMSQQYLSRIDQMIYNFDHHAAGQWIFNYVLNTGDFKFIEFSQNMHNASWFWDTGTYEENGYLKDEDGIVLFNHTKFLNEYRYK